MQVCDRYFRGGDEEVVFVFQTKKILLKFGKLTGTCHRRAIHHQRRDDLSIPMLGGVPIEHVVDQRTFQPGSGPRHDRKPGSCNLRGPIEIQDAEVLSDFPMGFGRIGKGRDGSPSANFNIFGCIGPHRDGGMGEIGDAKGDIAQGLLDGSQRSFGISDAVPHLLHRRHGGFSRFFGSAETGDLFRALIEFKSELFDLCCNRSSFFAQPLDVTPLDVVSASSESSADVVEVLAELFEVVHRASFQKNRWNLAPGFLRVNETDSTAASWSCCLEP